jgi:hypothetical protein
VVHAAYAGGMDPWLEFWRPFLLSPGAAAAAALVAAIITFAATSRSTSAARQSAREAERQRDVADRQQQWWAATMWAADHSLSVGGKEAAAGYQALRALQTSPAWSLSEHQISFISSLTSDVLEEAGVLAEPHLAGAAHPGIRLDTAPTGSRLRYGPEVYVAAAQARVTANDLLDVGSPERLRQLATGDISVLD